MSRQLSAHSWKPTNKFESNRLSASTGWKLPGSTTPTLSRTRGKREQLEISPSEDAVETPERPTLVSCNSTDVSTLTDPPAEPTPVKKKQKPSPTRGIFELKALKSSFEKYSCCPVCSSGLIVTFPTCCIATGIRLQCSDDFCSFIDTQRPELHANIPLPDDSGSPLIERSTDYAINIMYVIGFLQSGDGGAEAGRLLGLLGLPNSTTMEKRSFTIIEKRIGPILQKLAKEILRENLEEEVAIYFGDEVNTDGDSLFDLWKERKLPQDMWPRLMASTDMGWQKRSSGRNYSSLSGHALFVALLTRKPIALATKHKVCRYCKVWHTRHTIDEAVPAHDCVINHDGSSGSMEAKAVRDMYVQMYEEDQVIIDTLITDDDSTIKAKLKWSNADYMLNSNTQDKPTIINSKGNVVERPDHGEVPRHIPEPGFLADPGHRKKTLKGELYRLEKKVVAVKKTMTKCDCVRISTNFGYMTRTLQGVPPNEYVNRGQAVLEHHFDCHDYCGSFCHRKNQTDDEKKASAKYYRSKEKDKELYALLHDNILPRFLTHEALLEVAHGTDTLVKESLNNTISWVAPKNKTYSTTQSLLNRIYVAVGINGLGIYLYFCRLFDMLGVVMPDDICHYLQQVDKRRTYKINKSKEIDQKKRRQERFHAQLAEHTEKAKKDRCKREGSVYEPGIGMGNGYCRPAQGRKLDMTVTCSSCKEPGHKRSTNKLCNNYKPRQPKHQSTANTNTNTNTDDTPGKTAEQDQLERDAREQDLMDAMPFLDDDDQFFDSFEGEEEMEEMEEALGEL